MMPSFDTGTVKDRTARGVLVEHLALENAAVLQSQMEHIPAGRVRHRIELHDGHRILQRFQGVADAPEVTVTTVQTPDSAKRLPVRQLVHTSDT